ncbi:MAG: sugar phosphate isomerase/epimerase [Clostridia bacterium]|nr:sugar phosphate isomerase/epimerase [Clostridia bacterium]
MKLGAQFYTLRNRATTPEGIEACFREIKAIGYEVAQMSAIGPIEPERLRDISHAYALPITCTHSPFDRIVHDTDALIREHRIYECPVIGLGSMPNEYRGSIEGARAFLKILEEPAKRIRDAGLRLAYHNHHFEFDVHDGRDVFDVLLEEAPLLDFILDVYWVSYAGRDPLSYIRRIGHERMTNLHFKDMKTAPQGDICPCGDGVLDMRSIADLCYELGIDNGLVEQDNAPELGDELEQMKRSFEHLRPLVR